jgi:hypothetical protein
MKRIAESCWECTIGCLWAKQTYISLFIIDKVVHFKEFVRGRFSAVQGIWKNSKISPQESVCFNLLEGLESSVPAFTNLSNKNLPTTPLFCFSEKLEEQNGGEGHCRQKNNNEDHDR